MINNVDELIKAISVGSLIGGSALQVEDLNVMFKIVKFDSPTAYVYRKYKGKTSKRRFKNILKMVEKRHFNGGLKLWKDLINE